MRIVPTALLTLLLAAPSLPAHAKGMSLAGVTLPETVDAKGNALVLNGLALRKKFVVKVYVGGLYLAAKEKSAAKVLANDGPRRQVMHFLYSVTKEQMCEAWDEGLKQNTPNATPEVKKGFATLCNWMEPVPKGNQIVLTYIPGEGTTVEVNGKAKGTIPGKATADAALNTWIGPDPAPGEDFKAGVLGQ
jgi:hypothetical protein